MSDDELLREYGGQIMQQNYNAGFVALSFFVSLVGTGSTLELINRRTGLNGLFNHILLVSSAVTMGGVAIWCMHFIGNRAIDLASGEPKLQIAYSGGITALSFIVPIVVLLAAFIAVGSNNRVSWWRVGTGGVLCGAAVCGMHYLGNASIENYICIYEVGNVIGAAAIAVAASTIALAMFFVFRSIWANSWWKRLLSAVVLAGAVSGMHWVAAVGTSYRLKTIHSGGAGPSRDATVIVVICLSVSACFIIAGSAVLRARNMSKSARRAQKVTLGAAVFDKYGRILVDTDGVAPSAVITESFLEKHAKEGFNIAHPLFHWMFQASRSWPSISSLISGMKSHLITLARPGLDRSKSFGIELVSTHGEVIDDYDLIFRELFCVAAATLCDRMNQPLTAAGLLWDEILPTGAFNEKSRANLKKSSSVTSVGEKAASLSGQEEYGRGSLLFLVRHVDDRDAARLASAGYRFAEVHQVASVLRSRMQIQSGEIESKLRQMASYAENNAEPARGVHLGFFGMRARVNTSGFSVLVNKNSRSTLPTVSMKLSNLDAVQRDFLQRFNGSTVLAMLQALEKPPTSSMTALDTKFAESILSAITELRGYIRDPLFDEALFSPRTFTVPITRGDRTETMELLAFRLVIPIHSVLISPTCEFIPFTFFKVQQASLQDQLVFSQGVHRELGPVVK
ncbi:hypothetical protein CC79DRAFT_1262586, partial [Sarocladium strictum]